MKRMTSFTMIIALVLSMLVLTACGKFRRRKSAQQFAKR